VPHEIDHPPTSGSPGRIQQSQHRRLRSRTPIIPQDIQKLRLFVSILVKNDVTLNHAEFKQLFTASNDPDPRHV